MSTSFSMKLFVVQSAILSSLSERFKKKKIFALRNVKKSKKNNFEPVTPNPRPVCDCGVEGLPQSSFCSIDLRLLHRTATVWPQTCKWKCAVCAPRWLALLITTTDMKDS